MRRVHHRDGHTYCTINNCLDEKICRRSPKRLRTAVVIPTLTSMPRLKIAEACQARPSGAADIEVARPLKLPVYVLVPEVRCAFKDDKGALIDVAHTVPTAAMQSGWS